MKKINFTVDDDDEELREIVPSEDEPEPSTEFSASEYEDVKDKIVQILDYDDYDSIMEWIYSINPGDECLVSGTDDFFTYEVDTFKLELTYDDIRKIQKFFDAVAEEEDERQRFEEEFE